MAERPLVSIVTANYNGAAFLPAAARAVLAQTLGELVDYSLPDGGLAFWLRFRREQDLDRIEAGAPALGLRFATSRSFMARESAPRGLRVGFASLSPVEARVAIRALRTALD